VRLKNDTQSENMLRSLVSDFYKKQSRSIFNYLDTSDEHDQIFRSHYLIDRKHVLRISISIDRGLWLSSFELGIGPAFFSAAEFWSYENFQRFRHGTEPDDIVFNLKLLDEFLGYKHLPPP
jgi:hypothetical protein